MDRIRAARRRGLPRAEQEELLSAEPMVRALLAQNPDLDDTVACALASDPEHTVRALLAASAHLRAPAAEVLLGDAAPIRTTLAGNPTLPWSVVSSLTADPSRDVRVALAANRALEHRAVVALSFDEPDVVRSLASNYPPPRYAALPTGVSVRFLQGSLMGRALLDAYRADRDLQAWSVLADDFEGSLADLLAVVDALS